MSDMPFWFRRGPPPDSTRTQELGHGRGRERFMPSVCELPPAREVLVPSSATTPSPATIRISPHLGVIPNPGVSATLRPEFVGGGSLPLPREPSKRCDLERSLSAQMVWLVEARLIHTPLRPVTRSSDHMDSG
jgi:hypothetical protein